MAMDESVGEARAPVALGAEAAQRAAAAQAPQAEVVTVAGCDLCEAARMTAWYVEDDVCWIADCEICDVPMVVWRSHGTEPPASDLDHMKTELGRVADTVLGVGI